METEADTDGWRKVPITLSELCISTVLRCGQSFRWKNTNETYSCALHGRILQLRQTPSHLHYKSTFPLNAPTPKEGGSDLELIRDYFNLDTDLKEAYERWSERDPHFKKFGVEFGGVRMLRQDPWENLVSFICSSNNNISRISQMVENLCLHFGPHIGTLDSTAYHDFPPPSALAAPGIEEKLRKLGFGYRAKYIHKTAQKIAEKKPSGLDWLAGLRKAEYREAHESLLELDGVGPKVADCVCLMSLDKKGAVPVDTHVWQIAQRDYKFKLKGKSLNKAIYDAIGDHFRDLWGPDAGWAHSVLFAADLRAFADKAKEVTKVKTEIKAEVKINEEETITEDDSSKKRTRKSVIKKEVITSTTASTTTVTSKRGTKRKAAEVIEPLQVATGAVTEDAAIKKEDGSEYGVRKRRLRSGRER